MKFSLSAWNPVFQRHIGEDSWIDARDVRSFKPARVKSASSVLSLPQRENAAGMVAMSTGRFARSKQMVPTSSLSRFMHLALGAWLGALLLASAAQAQTINRSVADPALLNVLNQPLQACSHAPLTGYLRDGSCAVSAQDAGIHGVCAVMNAKFLAYTKAQGNDLSTPNPATRFPGLKPGDHWCVCAGRWQQALDGGAAPKVVLAATSKTVLNSLFLDDLAKHAVDPPAHLPPQPMPSR
ncbi:MAG: DUF2237 family protein [Thiomonas sp.]